MSWLRHHSEVCIEGLMIDSGKWGTGDGLQPQGKAERIYSNAPQIEVVEMELAPDAG